MTEETKEFQDTKSKAIACVNYLKSIGVNVDGIKLTNFLPNEPPKPDPNPTETI
jgi:hypothetical protein